MPKEEPIAGVDYPRTLQEFNKWFSDEKNCWKYIIKTRWSDGYKCSNCETEDKYWITSRGYLHCKNCGKEISIKAGTIFERSQKKLYDWFHAMWYITNQKYGANALGLQRILGLNSYQTAWTWLHKLRSAMVVNGRNKLSQAVEIDETYIGGPEKEVFGRELEDKALVIIAAEMRDLKKIGRIRIRHIDDVSSESIIPFVTESIKKGTLIRTDAWPGYNDLKNHGYKHDVKNIKQIGKKAHVVLPRVHLVASLLKRWLTGTYQGGVQKIHLDYYLDEFTFRFNRRTSNYRGLLFFRLMEQAVSTTAKTYRKIVDGN